MASNPFASSRSTPGHGNIKLILLPPTTPVLQTLSYQYPLKLIAPVATTVSGLNDGRTSTLIHTVFLLTYGGGLVAGDAINLHVDLAATTRLVLLTQGSTKIFNSPQKGILTKQFMSVDLADSAALCYLPDPVQPFADSEFEQQQIYNIRGNDANLCVCDWVSEGRPARDERWSFRNYTSKNEVWAVAKDGARRLMLRDNLILNNASDDASKIFSRMEGHGIFATLIIRGALFKTLGEFFLAEFRLLPRIGARQWDPPSEDVSAEETARAKRIEREKVDGVLWSAASVRGFVVVKFAASAVEGAKGWLKTMLRAEGTVEKEFGEGSLLCLR